MNKSILGGMLFGVVVGTLIISLLISTTSTVSAGSGKILRGTTYITPLGDPVEVLVIPGFGKCLFASAYVICK